MRGKFIFFLGVILNLALVSASLEVGFDDFVDGIEFVDIIPSEDPINYSLVPTVNSSDFWDGFDDPSDFLLSMFDGTSWIDEDLDLNGQDIVDVDAIVGTNLYFDALVADELFILDWSNLTDSLTNGSIVFYDGLNLAEDNSNLFWDNVNKRLGIGTASPTEPLTIFGETISSISRGLLVDVTALGDQRAIPFGISWDYSSTDLMNYIGGIYIGNLDTTNNNYAAIMYVSEDTDGVSYTFGTMSVVFTDHTKDSKDADYVFSLRNNDVLSEVVRFKGNGKVGINVTSVDFPLQVNSLGASNISIYALGNVSATGYITRTSVFDKLKNVWDYIKDADYYKTKDKIDHKKFYGYTGEYEITDLSKPVIEFYNQTLEYFNETLNQTIIEVEFLNRTIYPYKKTEEGVSLDAEINLLRQAVFELNERVNYLEENCVMK